MNVVETSSNYKIQAFQKKEIIEFDYTILKNLKFFFKISEELLISCRNLSKIFVLISCTFVSSLSFLAHS